jgi:hypothetical protein
MKQESNRPTSISMERSGDEYRKKQRRVVAKMGNESVWLHNMSYDNV